MEEEAVLDPMPPTSSMVYAGTAGEGQVGRWDLLSVDP